MASSAETPDTSDTAPAPGTGESGVDPLRAEVAAASEGDQVRLAIDAYAWQSALDVVDASEPVEWDARFDDREWWTRSLVLDAARVQYLLVYNAIPDPAECILYRYEDGERADERGRVEHFARVFDPSEEYVLLRGTSSGTLVYHQPDPDNPSQPGCRYAGRASHWYPKHPRLLGDNWELCTACDPDTDAPGGDGDLDDGDTTVALPDGVTPSDVEQAVDDCRDAGGAAKIGAVADALDLSVGRTRTVTHALDLYQDGIVEVYRPSKLFGGGQ